MVADLQIFDTSKWHTFLLVDDIEKKEKNTTSNHILNSNIYFLFSTC